MELFYATRCGDSYIIKRLQAHYNNSIKNGLSADGKPKQYKSGSLYDEEAWTLFKEKLGYDMPPSLEVEGIVVDNGGAFYKAQVGCSLGNK